MGKFWAIDNPKKGWEPINREVPGQTTHCEKRNAIWVDIMAEKPMVKLGEF